MKRSTTVRFFALIRSTARMLMQEQERSIVNSAAFVDLRAMPEYLRRDIGLVDGNLILEGVQTDRAGDARLGHRWSELLVTPHAA